MRPMSAAAPSGISSLATGALDDVAEEELVSFFRRVFPVVDAGVVVGVVVVVVSVDAGSDTDAFASASIVVG